MVTRYHVCDTKDMHLNILIAVVVMANHGTLGPKAGRDTKLDNGVTM